MSEALPACIADFDGCITCGDHAVELRVVSIDDAPVEEKMKPLLRYVRKLTQEPSRMTGDDVAAVRAAGWSDEAIYYAINTCALFNFYNRWITATGVPEMSEEAHRRQGRMLAQHGYVRRENK